jgi:cytochrome c oxidase cbb3-type subunit IV
MSTYQYFQDFAAKWGFAYFAIMFAIGCAYAFWPSRKSVFDKAARQPLDED